MEISTTRAVRRSYVSVPAAMRITNAGRSRLLAAVIKGDLEATSVAGRLFIDKQSLTAWHQAVESTLVAEGAA